MVINQGDDHVATVKKALFSPWRHWFSVIVEDGTRMHATGDFVGHRYRIEGPHGPIAEASSQEPDCYGVEITPFQNDALALAVVIAIEEMSHG
jgi:uncharacterized protein YxjI